ncbi:MAG: TonB-dependent receptor [Flavobacterium sp.]|jgi:hypothetical protein|uniref:TonB-dependent receptor n=1 Tax=Flavobacterium sp. TaxID=239 RepID=UPI0022BFE4AA|nr:TonB-dependent receptor [Flavobacterium sp.]MCZ8089420.1 TonB-dependent receptor [Flavobacterium sp.]MCZ8331222.1 TonB-dependent receptor [Flavobacterium sp.]
MYFSYRLVLFLFVSLSCFSQGLKGKVADETKQPVAHANVQLLDIETGKTIDFTKTDNNGKFIFKLEDLSFPIKIKITHFLYENHEIQLQSYSSNEINILLKTRITELKEVIIENKTADVVEKNDTIKYNLKNLLVGTETKLKDIIGKLPGLSIDKNKIKFNGTVIDNILIDGDEFFKENHQLATENLTSEMIEKIEMLKNYQDLSSIEGFENSGQTALNIGLKKSFRDIFKGNLELEGGIKERYKIHNNLFNYGSKNKFNLISDTNNLNENVFSPFDYIELKKVTGKNLLKDKQTLGIETATENEIPPFIFAQDNVNSISTKNLTLNFARKPNKNKRFEFISILNQTNIAENNRSLQTFLDGNSSTILDQYHSAGKSIFSTNLLKFENKISTKSYLQTNVYLFTNLDNQNQDLNNLIIDNQDNTLFKNTLNLKSLKTGFNILYKTKSSEKLLFEGVIYNDYKTNKTTKNFNSNKEFTGFDFNENQIIQTTNFETLSLGLKTKATLKLDKSAFDFKFISTIDNETLSNENNIGQLYEFNDTFTLTTNNLSLIYTSDNTKKLKYTLGLEFSNNNHSQKNIFTNTINSWLPSINLSYKISNKVSSFLGYSIKQNNPSIYNLISGNLIENQRTVWKVSDLVSEQMLSDNFNAGLFYIDIPKNLFSNFNITYLDSRKQISNNFINNNLITQQFYQYLKFGNSINVNTFLSKKFKNLPLGLNFSSSNSLTNRKVLSGDTTNDNEFNQNSLDFSVKSYFKNKINFDIGIQYLSNFSKLKIQSDISKNQLITTSPFVSLDGTLFNKKINWKIKSTYHIFNSSFNTSNNIMDLGFKANYIASSKLSLYLNANNIFNIRENNTKNNFFQNEFMTKEMIINTLSGFINLGISLSF